MEGNLATIDVPAVLDIARQMPGKVRVNLVFKQAEGIIYVEDARIVHAILDGAEGIDALSNMLGWEEGHFHLENIDNIPHYTIDGEWNSVLLAALQQMDEQTTVDEQATVTEKDNKIEESNKTSSLEHRIKQLETILEHTGFDDAAVISHDGLLLASTSGLVEAESDLLGAVAAAIFSLGMRSVKQLQMGSLKQSVIQSSDANIVVASINKDLSFIGIAHINVPLGILFAETRTVTRILDTYVGYKPISL